MKINNMLLASIVLGIMMFTSAANAGEINKHDHTYFFENWDWEVTGTIIDVEGNVVEQSSTIKVDNSSDMVRVNVKSIVHTEEPMEMEENYEMVPFAEDSDTTTWSTVNPHVGEINGTFWIHDDKIISQYASLDGSVTGCDFYKKLSDEEYYVIGAIYTAGKPIAKWEMTFTKMK